NLEVEPEEDTSEPEAPSETSADLAGDLPTPQSASNPSGTPFFMAPEQTAVSAEGISPLTDIYLLGGTLYYILTNDFPHRALTSEKAIELAAKGFVIPFEDAVPSRQIPTELEQITMNALAASPADRIQSVAEFIERVENYLSGASNRRESQRLVLAARENLAKAFALQRSSKRGTQSNYQHYVEGLSDLSRAIGLWPGNPEIIPLREKIIDQYTREALRNDDLNLARSHVKIVSDARAREVLENEIKQRTDQLTRQSLQRRVAAGLVGVLLVALIVGGAAYIRSQLINQKRISEERDQAQDARTRADNFRAQAESMRQEALGQQQLAEAARAIAENEQYYANIALASSSLDQDRVEKAQDLLMNKTPLAYRNWEWGRLLSETQSESAIIGRDGTTHACFTADGREIITGDREGRIGTWSATTGDVISEFRVHNGRIWDVEISKDGNLAYSSSFDKIAIVSNAETGEVIRRFEGHDDLLRGIALSHDGKRLLTCSQDQTARIWDTGTGGTLIKITDFKGVVYHGSFSPDDSRVVTACRDGSVRVWNSTTGEMLLDLKGQKESALSACYSDDGTKILSGGTDRIARLYDASTGDLIREFENNSAYIHSAIFNHQGNLIATAADDGVGRLWDVASGAQVGHFAADSPMWKVNFSSDDSHIVTCSAHTVRIWKVDRILAIPQIVTVSPMSPEWMTPVDTARIFGLPRGRDPSWREKEQKWNVADGRTLIKLQGRQIAIDSHFTAFSPDGATRIDIDRDTYFGKVVNAKTGELIKELPRKALFTAIYSPDGKIAAVIQPIDRIELFDTTTWESRGVLQMDPGNKIKVAIQLFIVASAAFSPDGKYLVVPYLNDHIVLWDVQAMQPVYTTEKSAGLGPCVAFNQAGDQFAIAGNDDRISLWNTSDGKLIRLFVGHTRPVSEVDFSPDGKRLVSHSRDFNVKLWETKTGREIMTVYVGDISDTVLAAHFTKDGRAIFIATASGLVKIFDAFPWEMEDYPDPELPNFQDRIEKWKRLNRLQAGE
ncbi:MAG: hypothetical protein ABI579_07880, partial [Candidatus Sumerlaeota bacterium]